MSLNRPLALLDLVTDQRLRDLERDAALGDLHAQARLLLERVRVGDLTEERLRLAAYLGHEPAELARRLAAISPPETPADTRSLASGLRHFEQSISVRAVVTIARSRLPAWERWSTTDRRPLLAIEAAESWLDCPCELHMSAAADAHDAVRDATQPLVALSSWQLRHLNGVRSPELSVCQRAKTAGYAAGEAARAAASGSARHASASVLRVLGHDEDETMQVVRTALVPWALAPSRSSP